MSKWISKSRRLAIYDKSGYRCHYCGTCLTYDTATIDHIIARENGGQNNDENLVMACRSCNSRKNKKTLEEFRLFISLNNKTAPVVYNQCQIDQINKLGLLKAFGVNELHKFYFEVKQ